MRPFEMRPFEMRPFKIGLHNGMRVASGSIDNYDRHLLVYQIPFFSQCD